MPHRLRGNSFFLLLLRAAKKNLGNGNRNGLTRADLWADFMRVFDDKYNPRKPKTREVDGYGQTHEFIDETLKKYFSEYLSGVFHSGSSCLPQNLPAKAKSIFSNEIDYSEFKKAIERINETCNKYLNLPVNGNGNEESSKASNNELVMETLVAGIIETIKYDDTFKGPFFSGYEIVDKEQLYKEKKYILQLFLFDIWYKIVTEHYGDAKAGKDTCAEWTQRTQSEVNGEKEKNEPRVMTDQIGQELAKTLKVVKDVEELDYNQIYQKLLTIYKTPKRLPLPTEIEPKLKAHIEHYFETYKVRNIPIKTPQMLYMLLQYPDCKLLTIFNAIQPDAFFEALDCNRNNGNKKTAASMNEQENPLKPKSPYGIYLINFCECFNKLYENDDNAYYDESDKENFFVLIKQGMKILQKELSGLNDEDYNLHWRRFFYMDYK